MSERYTIENQINDDCLFSYMLSLFITNIHMKKKYWRTETKLDITGWKSQINDINNIFTNLLVMSITDNW